MGLAQWADRASGIIGRVSGWLFFIIGIVLTYDVAARFLFHSPTAWAGDISVILQIWVVYLGMAYVLRERGLIRITAFVRLLGPLGRKLVEGFSLVFITLFSVVMTWESILVVMESVARGRRAPTMIETPMWIPEIAIPIGFSLLALQALLELARLPSRPAPAFTEEDSAE